MSGELETDYLVVGAGAAGMAITDSLLAHSQATITIVDRRHAPGGHWLDAYPFVRLHQPSAFYGVDSVPIAQDAIDSTGTNAGFYELAGADELRAYFERVMHRHLLASGRVRYFPSSEWTGEQGFVSRLTGATQQVRIRRKLIDTTYIEGELPSTSPPPFPVADGVRCIAAGELARLSGAVERFAIIGGGKTALDACVWLLEHGVSPKSIRWIRPRDAWWMNRRFQQPHTMLPDLYRGVSLQVEAIAEASSVDDVFARLEAHGVMARLDPKVEPTMFRGAIVSDAELALLRQVEDVVRMGHVKAITRDQIQLEQGTVPTDERTVHVHCAARGLKQPALRPIFEPGRITVQPFTWGFACYQFATLGVVEATVEDDAGKNWMCPPLAWWDRNRDYLAAFAVNMFGERARGAHPALGAWMKTTRLNPLGRLGAFKDDPRVVDARERIKRFGIAATENLPRLLAA